MVKLKQKHVAEVVKNNAAQSTPSNLSSVAADSDFSGEDSWVVVKKQRVNILIPCLPVSEPSTMLDDGNGQLPDENPPEACLEDTNDVLMSFVSETNTKSVQKVSTPKKLLLRKPRNGDRVEALRGLHGKETNVMKFPETSTVRNSFTPFQPSRLYGASTLPSATTVLNKMMRASNLERKIVRAGGMSSWLSSLGLEQFVTVFHGKKVTKFQLANLSMQKLKEMGVHAVGPRRKLIHAIECLCEPYCFQSV